MTIDTASRPESLVFDSTPRRLLSPEQLSTYLSIGRTAAYGLVKSGGPLSDDVVRIGRSIRVPVDAVDAFIARGGVR